MTPLIMGDGIKAGNDVFAYDGVSRIAEADLAIDSQTRKQQYTFDAFGNLTKISTDGGHGIFQDRRLDTDIATNHLTNDVNADNQGTYDGAGNLKVWNRHDAGVVYTYSYYPLGDMLGSARTGHTYTYAYDADGERVASNDDHFSGDTGGILYTLRGLDGKVRREYTEVGGTWTWTKDVIYRDGQLLASVGADTGRRHFHLDHLGTPRLVTDRCGAVTSRHTNYPFGEDALDEIALYGSQVPERMPFTGHERDLAATSTPMDDLDYMHARYYSPVLGRSLATDTVSGRPGSGLSWNRFAYVRGNPLRSVDPDGRAEYQTITVPVNVIWDTTQIKNDQQYRSNIATQLGVARADYARIGIRFQTTNFNARWLAGNDGGLANGPIDTARGSVSRDDFLRATFRKELTVFITPQLPGGGSYGKLMPIQMGAGYFSSEGLLSHELGHTLGNVTEERNFFTNVLTDVKWDLQELLGFSLTTTLRETARLVMCVDPCTPVFEPPGSGTETK